ncbi:DUF155-domain-containing protein [Coniochaeta ligniaria NRRL 30616]|uniref:DUF155-domain-containing protein n=1 Tax=Coniochaeta ligniaria NRRL 30616 TaxID=1408157 RepID=A0A1J7JEA1_9PEZI|nr:DUF155-domain-containing protein [Coniochaeta ligniaria NRRL 30616]
MPPMRFVSVDNVLQYASEIPSGQPRLPPGARPTRAAIRRGSFGAGGGLPLTASAKSGQQIVPSRTTKVSEKLVLLPETVDEGGDEDDGAGVVLSSAAVGEEDTPLRDEELDVLRKRGGVRGKSYAERLPKVKRGDKVARLTAYCTAQAYKLKATSEFLKKKHEARTKLYDDCLYTVYHLPLLQGIDGYRLRSRPILKTPGTGKTVLDLEIERSERRDVHEGYFDEFAYSVRGQDHEGEHEHGGSPSEHDGGPLHQSVSEDRGRELERYLDEQGAMANNPINPLMPDVKNFAEMFVFSYGVVVFWNFTEHQEKDILADLTFAENETGTSLLTRPLEQSDFETEEFHFEYSSNLKRPRVFNDMITLLPRSDHMVKLTISHAIAQSTKLCFFEERMSETMQDAQHVPKRLALTGELNMTRTEIVKILGRLFKSRVDINLSSNILDVPNFFWDSEPNLSPLYRAIREYLEIDRRTKVLNERCRVFLDLAEILSDSVADLKMSTITWIIIVLIVISILVTVTEVGLRFGILAKEKGRREGGGEGGAGVGRVELRGVHAGRTNYSLEELSAWSRALDEREKAAVCGSQYVGTTFAGM